MTTVWRIVRARYAGSAFTGVGAQRDGGRFNSAGTAVVYTSDSPALALLEVRVHVPTFRGLRDRVLIPAEIEDALVEAVPEAALPAGWRERPPPRAVQAFGDAWVASGRSAVLRVPSVVVEGHANYLINPAHPDAGQIRIGAARPLALDPRLIEPGA